MARETGRLISVDVCVIPTDENGLTMEGRRLDATMAVGRLTDALEAFKKKVSLDSFRLKPGGFPEFECSSETGAAIIELIDAYDGLPVELMRKP